MVIKFVLLQYVVKESKTARLSAQRPVSQTRKPYRIVETVRVECCHDTESLSDAVVVYEFDVICPVGLEVGFILDSQLAQYLAYGEQSPGKEPF